LSSAVDRNEFREFYIARSEEALAARDIDCGATIEMRETQMKTSGKISRFSLDTLVNMLGDAGLEVDFRIKPPSRRVA